LNAPRYAALAAKLLGRSVPRGQPPPGDRERGRRTIERALRARTQRRRLVWCGVAAAAAVLVLWSATRFGEPTPGSPRPAAMQVSPLGRGAALLIDDAEAPCHLPARPRQWN
jgi:hypothetical protein